MRILFVTSTRIGDALLSTGLLDHLIRSHRGARVTVACGPAAAPLFDGVPGLDRIIVMTKKSFDRHWVGLWRETVGTHWDTVVDIRGSLATMLLRRGRRHAWYTKRTPRHRVVQLSGVLGLDRPASPTLWTLPAHEAEADRLVPEGVPVLALGPIANWRGKEWAIGRFAELAERLTAANGPLPDAPVMVLGGPGEREAAAPLLDALPADRRIDAIGNTSLLGAYACLKRSALFVGNDSGLMHMSAAAGGPTLGLFGPSPEAQFAPWGPRCAVVRTPESYEELFPPTLDVKITGSLMGSLTVDAVDTAARALLARAA